ncbi:MAG: serine/threonine-protein kinase [Dermatophilaceae bacterium]
MDPLTVRSLLTQIALGLGAAHQAGIIHRDVKPANILVTSDGTAKLTDFGIARSVHSLALTMTGEVMGTPQYLSPEQALGRAATTASDVYALGVVAHEMLSGVKPFDAETPMATALAHAYHDPPPLPSSTPPELAAVIRDCLLKDPRKRPATGRDVALRLDRADDPASRPATQASSTPKLHLSVLAPELDDTATTPPLPSSATADGPVSEAGHVVRLRPTARGYAVAALVFFLYLALILLTRR